MDALDYLDLGTGTRLAFRYLSGRSPTIVFLSGLRSTLNGQKASHLAALCKPRQQAFLRFDYRGHGQSDGDFEEHGIGDWHADTMVMLTRVVSGPLILVGSSMGGWQAILAALAMPARVVGIVGIAAAPDFTERVIAPGLDEEEAILLANDGRVLLPNAYGDPLPLTATFMSDAASHLVLGSSIRIQCPVHLLHGQADQEVPWQLALELAASLESSAVTVELIKDGDHRLSRPTDLTRIDRAIQSVMRQAQS